LRIKVYIRVPKTKLPKSYGYYLASFFFRTLEKVNEDVAYRLHRFSPFKPYNFSRILARADRVSESHLIFLKPKPAVLYFSSPFDEVALALLEALMVSRCIRIKGTCIRVERAEKVPPQLEPFPFRTLSPVTISVKKEKKVYLRPDQPLFYQELTSNFLRRFKVFTGNEQLPEIRIDVQTFKARLVWVKNSRIPAYDLWGRIEGDKEALSFLWDAGLGEKTGLGFGMVGTWPSTPSSQTDSST